MAEMVDGSDIELIDGRYYWVVRDGGLEVVLWSAMMWRLIDSVLCADEFAFHVVSGPIEPPDTGVPDAP